MCHNRSTIEINKCSGRCIQFQRTIIDEIMEVDEMVVTDLIYTSPTQLSIKGPSLNRERQVLV